MAMAVIVFDGAKPFEQIANTSLTKSPCEILKSVKLFQGKRHLKITLFYTHYIAKGQV